MRGSNFPRPLALTAPALLLALLLSLPAPAAAQDGRTDDAVFANMEEAKAKADAFKQQNKPVVNAKVAQLNALNTYLLSVDVAYHAWSYRSWILDIEERIVSGSPTCRGGSDMPGPCVAMRPGYDLPDSETGVYVYGLIKGYVNVAGGGVMAQPSVTGNAFTAILFPDQPRCLAATTTGLWSEELRTKVILPLNVLVDGTHTFYVIGDDIEKLPETARKEFQTRFEALGSL